MTMAKQWIAAAGVIMLLMSGCASVPTEQIAKEEKVKPMSEEPKKEAKTFTEAVIQTEKGEIVFKFYSEDAPNTIANFVKLAEKGFYDGLTFHRVVPNFVAQGGCPKGDGTGGPGYNIKAEFNKQKHLVGTVAMARAMDPDSAGSQFYICLSAIPHLDNQYTVFGQVTKGMDIVETIKIGDVMKKVSVR
jgi:peptidyl-prolyl cis-trans isomerase B (cyclophilin B)